MSHGRVGSRPRGFGHVVDQRLRPCCRPESSAKSIPTRLGKGFGLQLQNAQLMRVPVCRRDTSHQAFVLHPPFDCPSVHLVICCDITLSLHLAVAGPVCDFYQSVNSRRDKSKTRHEAQKKPIIGFHFDLNTCADSDGSWGDESVTSLAVGGSIPGHSSRVGFRPVISDTGRQCAAAAAPSQAQGHRPFSPRHIHGNWLTVAHVGSRPVPIRVLPMAPLGAAGGGCTRWIIQVRYTGIAPSSWLSQYIQWCRLTVAHVGSRPVPCRSLLVAPLGASGGVWVR